MRTRTRTTGAMTMMLCIALVGGTGCSSPAGEGPAPDQAPDPGVADIPTGATVVETEPLLESPLSGIDDRRRVVVRDEAEWRAVWSEATGNLAPAPEPPAVDFGEHMVVVATMGRRSSGGYAIEIDEVRRDAGRLYVIVVETSPAANCITTQALSAPMAAVRVPRADQVTFVESEATRDC